MTCHFVARVMEMAETFAADDVGVVSQSAWLKNGRICRLCASAPLRYGNDRAAKAPPFFPNPYSLPSSVSHSNPTSSTTQHGPRPPPSKPAHIRKQYLTDRMIHRIQSEHLTYGGRQRRKAKDKQWLCSQIREDFAAPPSQQWKTLKIGRVTVGLERHFADVFQERASAFYAAEGPWSRSKWLLLDLSFTPFLLNAFRRAEPLFFWKIARMVRTYKGGAKDSKDPFSYRPICLANEIYVCLSPPHLHRTIRSPLPGLVTGL